MLSDAMEDYLKAVYSLQRDGGPPVSTSAVADYLEVSPSTVTTMMEKLEDRGLLAREKYRGVELTDEGRTVALEVLRHHRLLESYLAEHLDYDWSEVHEEAEVLEHHISEEFERRLAAALDDPAVDPHGDPIPDADLSEPEGGPTDPLSDREAGDRVVVARVRDRDPEELRYLAGAGVEPGRELAVRDVTPIGTHVVATDAGVEHLPESVAAAVRVEPVEGGDGSDGTTGADADGGDPDRDPGAGDPDRSEVRERTDGGSDDVDVPAGVPGA